MTYDIENSISWHPYYAVEKWKFPFVVATAIQDRIPYKIELLYQSVANCRKFYRRSFTIAIAERNMMKFL